MLLLSQVLHILEISVELMTKESRAIHKYCGIETEFGTRDKNCMDLEDTPGSHFVYHLNPGWLRVESVASPEWDPRARVLDIGPQKKEDEHYFFGDKKWRKEGNFLLPNGGRLYVDMGNPEYSTAFCSDSKMVVVWNRAGYRLLDRIRQKYLEERGIQYVLYRNNYGARAGQSPLSSRDVRRNTNASHLNFTGSREIPSSVYAKFAIPFLVMLNAVVGTGKVGGDNHMPWIDFQISQRADWIEYALTRTTTAQRPIYNIRDAPYADPNLFRRIHLILFDSNMIELPEYLKVGLVSIIFMMVEDGVMGDKFALVDPVKTLHKISRDIEFKQELDFVNQKKRRGVLDCLREYAELFEEYLELYHPQNLILKDVLAKFRGVLDKLVCRDWQGLFGELDWVTKKILIEKKLARRGVGWTDFLAMQLDIEYHNNDHSNGLFYRLIEREYQDKRITAFEEVEYAILNPPPTRQSWITRMRDRYGENIAYSDYWYSITFAIDKKMVSVRVEPDAPADPEFLDSLFSSTLDEFLERIKILPFIKVAKDHFAFLWGEDGEADMDADPAPLAPGFSIVPQENEQLPFLFLRRLGPEKRSDS